MTTTDDAPRYHRQGAARDAGPLAFGDAADQIAVIATTMPGSLDVLSGTAVRAISMKLAEDPRQKAARQRMMIALARADWEPADMPELRLGFAEGAIDALIEQGESGEAEGLLERIDQPESLAAMLTDRHYTLLWPAIEERLGPASTTSVDRFARDRLASFGDAPYSEAALRDAARAAILAKLDEPDALARSGPHASN
jgi:hypothetical protein